LYALSLNAQVHKVATASVGSATAADLLLVGAQLLTNDSAWRSYVDQLWASPAAEDVVVAAYVLLRVLLLN
jgi:hypothetical protein